MCLQNDENLDELDDEDDDGSDSIKSRGRRAKANNTASSRGRKPSRKPKVPPLKIRFGKRKRASSVSLHEFV